MNKDAVAMITINNAKLLIRLITVWLLFEKKYLKAILKE
jgi:hypothetical protein